MYTFFVAADAISQHILVLYSAQTIPIARVGWRVGLEVGLLDGIFEGADEGGSEVEGTGLGSWDGTEV